MDVIKRRRRRKRKKKDKKEKETHEICVLKGTKFRLKIPILCQHENCMW